MSTSHQQTIEEKMQALKASYLKQLEERCAILKSLVAACVAGNLDLQGRTDLKMQAHKLAGTGTTYGFPSISEAGKRLEESLIDHPDEKAVFFVPLAQALLTACTEALGEQPKVAGTFGRKASPTSSVARSLPQMLIVDDDSTVREILSSLFEQDAHIITATNTSEALEMMQRHKPDLVLLDDMMPGGISGLKMLENLKGIPELANIPVIMITASDKPEEVMRGLLAGAADYITKPFNPDDVAARVRARLKRQNSSILIVDDDQAVRELLAHKFQMAGCKVFCAADGAEAWAMMRKQPFALAVLDRMMPGYDGMTLLRMMQENKDLANIPVVFLTARHYGSDVLEGLNTGAVDYITKPFNPDEVVTRCIRLIAGKGAGK